MPQACRSRPSESCCVFKRHLVSKHKEDLLRISVCGSSFIFAERYIIYCPGSTFGVCSLDGTPCYHNNDPKTNGLCRLAKNICRNELFSC